jgi:hypothetical protein
MTESHKKIVDPDVVEFESALLRGISESQRD